MLCKTVILLGCAMLAILSCSKDTSTFVNTVPIYQDLKVTFDKTTRHSTALANFRANNANGLRLALNGSSDLLFNGNHPQIFSSTNAYSYTYEADSLQNMQFTFKKSNEQVFNNTISLKDTTNIDLPPTLTNVSIRQNTTIPFTGKPLQFGEQVTVYLVQHNTQSGLATESTPGVTSLVFPASLLSNFTVGSADLYIERTGLPMSLSETDGTAGGQKVTSVVVAKRVIINE
ncbi:hypothetical protein LX64_04962 [Chitinophaga skermanii]|uniref:DUF4397 domain-containing protein n=1 Tax=Chitinophaga skermanii TaxID=331697 RepID=A0A327Q407_9BACT|nr:hypothetical protein [Chitinophaga skermanii]RAI97912.1 hypothetical protein LX64_04962 [Chitinophaga skermanii]